MNVSISSMLQIQTQNNSIRNQTKMLKPLMQSEQSQTYQQNKFASLKEQALSSLSIINQLLGSLALQGKQNIPHLHTSFLPQYDLEFTRIVHSKQVHSEDYNNWRTSVEIKHNWISNHLDDQTKTTKVIGKYKNQWVIIQDFDQTTHTFGIKSYSNKKKQETMQQSDSFTRIKSIALNQNNRELFLQFQQHQNLYQIQAQISRLQIVQTSKVLFNLSHQGLKRIAIFTMDEGQEQPYKYFDGKSSINGFIWPVLLSPGKYIIYIPTESLQIKPHYQIVTSVPQSVLIQKNMQIQQIQLYNLFVSAFKQKKQIQERRDVQMIRANYLDAGIVVQIIKNRYIQTIRLENLKNEKEDKQLLFADLYPDRLKHGDIDQLYARELVIRFYKLTAIPARLYIPQKKIVLGLEEIQCRSYHTVIQ